MLNYIAIALLLAGMATAQSPLLPKVTCRDPLPNGFTCANVYAVRWLTPPPWPSSAPPGVAHNSQPIVAGSKVYVPPLSPSPAAPGPASPAIHSIVVIIGATLYEANFNPPLSGVNLPDGVAALAFDDRLVLTWSGKEVAGTITRRQKLASDWRWYDPPWKRNRDLPLDQ